MVYRRANKSRILGITIVVFISFLLFLYLIPRSGIDAWVYDSNKIDSIHVIRYSSRSYTSISDQAEIAAISDQIKNCRPVQVRSTKIANLPFQLIVFSRRKKATLDFLDGYYDGKMIESNGVVYKNDLLWSLINRYYSKNWP